MFQDTNNSGSRPPTTNLGKTGSQANLGAANPAVANKWQINIQEIVKRTQRNLERGNQSTSSLQSLQKTFENTASLSEQETRLPPKQTSLYNELK